MYKEINEFDRMVIGVREWAVESMLGWERFGGLAPKVAIEYAQELEEYVLRGIKDEEKSQVKGTG